MVTNKQNKLLDHIKNAWEEIKKLQPNVKGDVEPIQNAEAERIRAEIEGYASKLRSFKSAFRKRPIYQYATGPEAAYPMMDEASLELVQLSKECTHFEGLAATFEFPQLMTPVIANLQATWADLVMVKDVWDTQVICDVQFVDWKKTLWTEIRTDLMEDGAKNFVKEVKSLNKLVSGRGQQVAGGREGAALSWLCR